MKIPVRSYAEALFAACGDTTTAERALAELEAVTAALQSNPAARRVLAYPGVAPEASQRLLETLARSCSPSVGRFLRVLFAKGRLGQLASVAQGFRDRVESAQGIVRARLQSARQPTADQQERLAAALRRRYAGAVVLQTEVRPELVGGARVIVGDRVLDGSLAGRLARLHRQLAQVAK